MRLVFLLFGGAGIVGTGWRIGTWCGDTFTEALDMYCARWAAKQMKKETQSDS